MFAEGVTTSDATDAAEWEAWVELSSAKAAGLLPVRTIRIGRPHAVASILPASSAMPRVRNTERTTGAMPP